MAEQALGVRAELVGLPAVLKALMDGPKHRQEIKDIVEEALQPDEALREQLSNGREKWWNYVLWGTTTMSKAGWMTKDGAGTWSITAAGRSAITEMTEPETLRREANRLYAVWKKATLPATRRAWLVRGSSVRGANLVNHWLVEGWCSLAASQLPEIDSTTEKDALVAMAEVAYAHLKHNERASKTAELVDFVTRTNSPSYGVGCDTGSRSPAALDRSRRCWCATTTSPSTSQRINLFGPLPSSYAEFLA